ncbi:MAG: endonuclease/exonuclease/phosphatase family protein [Spirochaetes bacterium]|nr:endonuclease/exonuclease/phosphatase family protein [Spirochaetota bacterium]
MKSFLRASVFILSVLLLTSFSKCSFFPEEGQPKELVIVSYNVFNLFDDVRNGTEYPEFDPTNGMWTSSMYRQRLQNTAKVIAATAPGRGPDIICLQEIENRKVLRDLATIWLKNYSYQYYVSADNERSAITTGIISRYPIKRTLNHSLFLDDFTNLRIITETVIEIGDTDFYIFNSHLKSKLGGVEFTEAARIKAAEAIAARCREIYRENPRAKIIVTGDLNVNIDEYIRQERRYLTAIMPLDEMCIFAGEDVLVVTRNRHEAVLAGDSVVFYSPWYRWFDEGNEVGSFMFRGSWQTLDHFLLTAPFFNGRKWEYSGFRVLNNPELACSLGYPRRWNNRMQSGYSDHFPIVLYLTRN